MGRHRRGTLELTGGGKDDPGEGFCATATQELQEETGLTADPTGIRFWPCSWTLRTASRG
ncbi:hypothetical protein AB0D59_31825 [Streptomyces sp. NPDC048417]|uniref:hypothetical protein n=1 Tax=Streptomyces sp. NPDC048417 TaxID=3155387 RepID=UPI00341A4FFE